MRVTIAVAHRKGGVGKTTLAVSLAAELDRRTGQVGLVDADVQASACQWADLGNLSFPVYQLEFESRSETEWLGLVRKMSHEILVVDSPPNDRALEGILKVSDIALLPCTPSSLDIEATAASLRAVQRVRALRRHPLPVLIVPNRVDRRTLEGQQLCEELEALGEKVAAPVGNRSAFIRAFTLGQSIGDLAKTSLANHEIRALADLVMKTCSISPKATVS